MDIYSKTKILPFSMLLLCCVAPTTYAATPTTADENAIFAAALFKPFSNRWMSKCSMGHITTFEDINKDGRMDAIIKDGGTNCYGNTGVGFYLMTKQVNQKWTRIFNSPGNPVFLKTVGRHGWPDLQIENSSNCFAIYRWDGNKYLINRYEFNGKICKTL